MPGMLRGRRRGHALQALMLLGVLAACSAPPPASTQPTTAAATAGHHTPEPAQATTSTAPTTPRPTRTGNRPSAAGRSSAHVSLATPGYDAPGSLVPAVATIDEPTNRTVRFTLEVPHGAGTCDGPTWRHPGGVSQSCWITLPRTPGATTIRATADLTDDTGTLRTAPATRTIRAKGVPTAPVDAARRDAIRSCGNTTDKVWLTFDDYFLSEKRMHAMLATLAEKKVRGRFFAMGTWAKKNPAMIAQLRAAGHLVENHTLSHEPLSSLTDGPLRAQITGGPTSDAPQLLRPGFGAGGFAARVVDTAADLGYQTCYWTVDPRDWAGPSPEQLISRVVTGDDHTPPVGPGGVVLMHMTGKHTAQALSGLIDAIRAKGRTLDPLP